MTKKKQQTASSEYVNQQRLAYSIYVLRNRAIPELTDGLKSGARRVLWTARDGKTYKCATLAGAAMPLHPHDAPTGAIDTLTAPYGNNIPLFTGTGAFGTLIQPKAYGASRYTSVRTSKFTEDVVFKDIEIIPMVENYDGELMEPKHFLPLVPIVLLNPTDGVAIGYATKILPRSLDDIIVAQIAYLKGAKSISNPVPKFNPTRSVSYDHHDTERGVAYYFNGELTRNNTTTVTITSLPYGQTHAAVIAILEDLADQDTVQDYTDRSRKEINIEVKFKRNFLATVTDVELYRMLGISVRQIENLNVIDLSGESIYTATPSQMIRTFTEWRLQWYVKRYERLRDLINLDLHRYYDIRIAIKNKVNAMARTAQTRSELKDAIEELGIVNVDYIADLPVYRFTEEERLKNEQRIEEATKQLQVYLELLKSETKRKNIYISELQDVLTKYNKGVYN